MIKDILNKIDSYGNAIPYIQEVREILSISDLKEKEKGKYEIPGGKCFYVIAEYETHPFQEGKFEWHKKYIDIQIVLKGEEIIYNTSLSGTKADENGYSEEKDIQYGTASVFDTLVMNTGEMAVLFPEDAHYPGCRNGKEPVQVKKLVIKVPAV